MSITVRIQSGPVSWTLVPCSFFAIKSSVGPTHCGVFKIVEAVVGENEPASFPGLHASPWWVRGHMSEGLRQSSKHSGEYGQAGFINVVVVMTTVT